VELLREMFENGIPDVEIAEKLGRTKNAVNVKRTKLHITDIHKRRFTKAGKQKMVETRKKIHGPKHPSWNGGKRVTFSGYVEVRNKDHHRARKNGYVFEHILVAEKKLGRKLNPNEQVHHKNKVKTDNRPENLEVIDAGEHARLHAKERRKGKYIRCVVCNKQFYRKPSHVKRAKCCSLQCVGKYTQLKRKGELA
jgi:hypothetical protein